MSYDQSLLFKRILNCLGAQPRISLQDLAKYLHVSQRTVEKTVRLRTGKTFRELRKDFVIQGFRSLARTKVMSIKEVSAALGYASPRALARTVRGATGMSPTEARSRMGGRAK